jgi:CheY-like chemotaxis protein
VALLDVLARCARCGLAFAGAPEDCTPVTELLVLHTRFCLGDDRSAEVWAPYEAVYASLRRHVVVAGADRDARQALGVLLQRSGHRVDEAADAPAAVELALERRPDVVLVDVDLPSLAGYGVAERIRAARGRQAPLLVALTGHGRPEERRRARAAGFDTSLVKPPAAEEIERVVVAAPRVASLRA